MRKRLAIIYLAILVAACQYNTPENNKFKSLKEKETGIDFVNELRFDPTLNILEYLYYYNGGGVGIGDLNGDGLEDVYFTGNQVADQLYFNQGNMKFKNVSKEAGISQDPFWSTGVSIDDVNNDGHLDIYVSKIALFNGEKGANELYINQGDGTFVEMAKDYGVDFEGFSTQAAFLDYDLDGDLDMYLLNHAIHSVRSYGTIKKRQEKDSLSGDRLYENKLNEIEGQFVEVTEEAGIYNSPLGYGLAVRVSDFNADGWPDLYVGNDFHENDLIYINNQDGTFRESVKDLLNHATRFTMGVDVGDLNNDGLLDIFSTDMMPYEAEIFMKSGGEDTDKVDRIKKDFGFEPQLAHNHMQINQGGQIGFSDLSLTTQTYATDWSWSVLLEDFDNDWDQDIFVSNGIAKRPNDLDYINYLSNTPFKELNQKESAVNQIKVIDQIPSLKISNFLFTNNGDLQFSPLRESQVGYPGSSTGAAFADLDADGDLDIVINNINEGAIILDNQTQKKGIQIELKRIENKSPKGSKVIAYKDGIPVIRELETVRGFQSSSSHKIHLGASLDEIDSLVVVWPGGKTQSIQADQLLSVIVNEKEIPTPFFRKKLEPIQNVKSSFPFKHAEDLYLDYERERLIPEQLSHEGPALVVSDFNQDGKEDVFLGGARYQTSALYLANSNGTYDKVINKSLATDSNYEDVDAAPIDIDGDGDLDLYVVSGGNDLQQNDKLLTDRLYLNDGKGILTRVPIDLPNTNGGSVAVGDFNQDGFEDLFVGSRSIPGAYGLSPESYVIQNIEGKGLKIFASLPIGMISTSKWEDINNDGFLDLIVAGDWMPITVFLNKEGKQLVDATKEMGLSETHGMWNTMEIVDINNDGKKDILAGNVGENFKWKASTKTPIKMYLDDYDKNDQIDPIIFYTFFGKSIPFASKDKLTQQLPYLKKRFQDYRSFSKIKTISDLTGKDEDQILATIKINELRSVLLLNTPEGFRKIPLPQKAQQSAIQDFEYDSESQRLFFVGNYLNYVVELGMNSAQSGGVFSQFNKMTNEFENFEQLNLPKGVNSREIKSLSDNELIITINDSTPLIIKK